MIYKRIPKDKIDYSTFTHALAMDEVSYAKDKIKEIFITGYMYTIYEILSYVKNTYDEEKRELFDEFFVFKALDELLPITENDFNNFRDTIIDKHNRPGYLIYRDKYYIFQPFDQNEDVPIYYRTTANTNISQKLSLYNYLKSTNIYQNLKDKSKKTKENEKKLLKKIINIIISKMLMIITNHVTNMNMSDTLIKKLVDAKIKLQKKLKMCLNYVRKELKFWKRKEPLVYLQ